MFFFGIEASQHTAEALLAVQKAASKPGGATGATTTLEKKKRKKGGPDAGGAKRTKLLDILTLSPLHSTRDSEDDGGKGSPVVASQPLSAVAQSITRHPFT